MLLSISPKNEIQKITRFLKQTLRFTGFSRLIIPLSGGIDSSTVAFLAAKIIGPENILITHLPYKGINKDNDYQLIVNILKTPPQNIFTINIKPVVDLLFSKLNSNLKARNSQLINKIRFGNLMSRVRMTILYDLAKTNNSLVCGTENKSEYLLGYFTLHGDNASDLEPIIHLYKTQVIQLAKYFKIPPKIINKPPSAGLWLNQTDQSELGFSYQEADPILYYYFDKKYSPKKITSLGFPKTLVDKVLTRAKDHSFKHHFSYKI